MSDMNVDPSNIEASRVNGTKVYNRQRENLGSIYDLVIGKRDGQVKYAIMSFGGFLGIGDEYHPLPWAQLDYDERQGGYVVDLDKGRLEGAPRFRNDSAPDWNDPTYGRTVDDYYGVRGL
ncbi:PRC-barrel domain-containing protein [Aurantimonas sp. C2-6-R+9]|uniref:PRC-barrel domain-containing protein n=1 Tax=unclassified Aurantimonas TaxID=2638230 RepID=UPI002E189CB9|nr:MULTISPECIES: PRC-barrel domain-containing protein [unclassified Aurantimonas]MEC5293262.1 PRC-barrel domain-containing protein [Aurantimonas sp. C2-3-R2]MEC5383424.1 PRC-barrel domain-containing protein [Aurantimonas sp. C2-6-R+9]MEC5414356.1 PRC-barrel domain-containing protein [Aurantimonas sp. C2-4-R8]